MKILVTGATGLIGKELISVLLKLGHEVFALSRSPQKLPELPESHIFEWSDSHEPPLAAIKNCDAIIHLAGEGIADKRWSTKRKQQLWNSRVKGTENIMSAILKLPADQRPKIMISGSAIGYYGSSNEVKTETSENGQDFLSQLCLKWEEATQYKSHPDIRFVFLRTGLVLSKNGGLLSKVGPAVLGHGKQWMSWIHIEDMINFVVFALDNSSLNGAYNMTAPTPVTNKELTQKVSKHLGFPITFNVPETFLKLVLGEMSEAVLANQKVIPEKAINSKFKFKFEFLDDALNEIYSQNSWLENSFKAKQFVPLDKKRVFSFFSKAENLEILTPPWLNFHIVKKTTPEIQKGTLIEYKLKIHGIPVKWRTLIQEWDPENSFVDYQLKGPYKKWHHLHTFHEVCGGTLISDDVTFEIPGWIFGKVLLPLIKKDISSIFNYRQNKIKELFQQNKMN